MAKKNIFSTIRNNFKQSKDYKFDIIKFNFKLSIIYFKNYLFKDKQAIYLINNKKSISLNHNSLPINIYNHLVHNINISNFNNNINLCLSLSYFLSSVTLLLNLTGNFSSILIEYLFHPYKDYLFFIDYDTTPVEIAICNSSTGIVLQHGVFSKKQFLLDNHSKKASFYYFLNYSSKKRLFENLECKFLSPRFNQIEYQIEYNQILNFYWIGQPQYLISEELQDIYKTYLKRVFNFFQSIGLNLIYLVHPAEDLRIKKNIPEIKIASFRKLKKYELSKALFLSFDSTLLYELVNKRIPAIQLAPCDFSMKEQKLFPSLTIEEFVIDYKENNSSSFLLDIPNIDDGEIKLILNQLK